MRLAGARRTKGDDISEDDAPSTSGRQFPEGADGDLLHADTPKVVDGLVPCFYSVGDSLLLYNSSL